MGYCEEFRGLISVYPAMEPDDFPKEELIPPSSTSFYRQSYNHWEVASDLKHIAWNGCEKFPQSVDWIVHICDHLKDKYTLNGRIYVIGEDYNWNLFVINNIVIVIASDELLVRYKGNKRTSTISKNPIYTGEDKSFFKIVANKNMRRLTEELFETHYAGITNKVLAKLIYNLTTNPEIKAHLAKNFGDFVTNDKHQTDHPDIGIIESLFLL